MPIKTTRRSRLRSTSEATALRTRLAVREAAFDAESTAKQLAPVDTGNLRNSIHTEIGRDQAAVRVGAEYGVHVEFGTVTQDAQPYFRPAVASARRGLRAALKVVRGEERVKRSG